MTYINKEIYFTRYSKALKQNLFVLRERSEGKTWKEIARGLNRSTTNATYRANKTATRLAEPMPDGTCFIVTTKLPKGVTASEYR